ncbi:hypothetical protein AUEXF2481DRAFT_470 [Aureobasidium subglaciale EXF-2481]|uniref:DUF7918 domain-containing protein n=1 Tax=Aureobasidium subglaciale (strain EXF-2481) TaxID=1043005 RepID=A0A074Z2I8_AURSE|nr:uncharacterized protein AUEXF2481DRAFT_470 [Aureobasidium subglaciale EXF-2481]KAI5199508.1 hypothetical protein E4T38_06975 [Aureobasidium subglaciale]KAI5218381.1 hypothetical protein E4T40_06906 [Aureobasidium subglaciale]KAI5221910.1 hypothetical protein E4T41_06826 [Aureobasidium subglaciale]KAI5259253.1 hypothetical protein E4T46_06804 [Aureobasidium subglaciale]KER00548.1 hypothetical protein AUEXF2481DRAFT_470 [Aureobasidium subglaciale EXF-2481]
MAILDTLPGLEVSVVVNGQDLHEYQDAHARDEEDTVTKYIEVVSDAYFAIKVTTARKLKLPGNNLSIHVTIDGVWVYGIDLSRMDKNRSGPYMIDSAVAGNSVGKLKFSKLNIVEEKGVGLSQDKNKVQKLGCIEVVVTHENKTKTKSKRKVRLPAPVEDSEDNTDDEDHEDNQKTVSEKDVKGQGVTHTYGLSEKVDIPRSKGGKSHTTKYVAVMGAKNPAGTFGFQYRTMESLKALIIVPRTPSPTPLEDRPEEQLTHEQTMELLRRYKAKEARNIEIKKEIDNDDYNSRAHKRVRSTITSTYLELNDDETFIELSAVNKEKNIPIVDLD